MAPFMIQFTKFIITFIKSTLASRTSTRPGSAIGTDRYGVIL